MKRWQDSTDRRSDRLPDPLFRAGSHSGDADRLRYLFSSELNSATLIGNLKVGQSWMLGFDADYRRSPLLLLTNALIGQSAPEF